MHKSPTRIPSQIGFHKIIKEKFNVMIKEDNESQGFKSGDQILAKERYPNVEIQVSDNSQISIRDILDSLKNEGCSFENKTISYFDPKRKVFIFCRREENLLDQKISLEDLSQKEIYLKCRQSPRPLIEEILIQNDQTEEMEDNKQAGKGKTRTKERTISEVVQKVAIWRKLYNGFFDANSSQVISKSLEEGAKQIGISKKTLDDYLSQIRLGKKYGFNFNENKDSKIGTLRAFVKKNRQKKTNSLKNEEEDG